MKILILHTYIPPDAPSEEQDTMWSEAAVRAAILERGHDVVSAPFVPELSSLKALLDEHRPTLVFNLVESVNGLCELAPIAPIMLEKLRMPYTGSHASTLSVTSDKILSKEIMRKCGLPTADWIVPPDWHGLEEGRKYIVKHATEDCSLGLDDGAVVVGAKAVRERAQHSKALHGGRWFAEAFIDGREFNVSCIEKGGKPMVLPAPEMHFYNWDPNRPKIVGYAAKWDEESFELDNTDRTFGTEEREPELAKMLSDLVAKTWTQFGMHGFGRVDFRLDAEGNPYILEINPNACLEPNCALAAAANAAGLGYSDLVMQVIEEGLKCW